MKKIQNLKKPPLKHFTFTIAIEQTLREIEKNHYSFNQIIKSKHSLKKNQSRTNFQPTREKKFKNNIFPKMSKLALHTYAIATEKVLQEKLKNKVKYLKIMRTYHRV